MKVLPLLGVVLALPAANSCAREAQLPQAAAAELDLGTPPTRVLPANAAWVDYVSLLVGPERVVALPPEAFGYSRLTQADGAWAALASFPVFEGERALALAPDLVLVHTWQNPETVATLRRAGVPVLACSVPKSWEEVTATLTLLGTTLGETERARTLLTELEDRREALRGRAARFGHLSAMTYTNLGAGGWTSGAGTTGHVLLALAGLENASARAGLVGDAPADAERLLALAPDVLVVGQPDRSERAPPSAEFLLSDPALAELEAVRARRIATLPPALFTSASPELLTGAERLLDELERIQRETGALAR